MHGHGAGLRRGGSGVLVRGRSAPGVRQGLQARGLAQGRARGQAGAQGSWFGSGPHPRGGLDLPF